MYLPVRVSILIFSPVLMKSGGLHRDAGLDGHGLHYVVGGVALDAIRSVGDGEHHAGRHLDLNGLVIDEGHDDGGVLDQVTLSVAHDLGHHRHGLEGLGIGEHIVIPVHVAELHLASLHRDHFDLLRGAETHVGGLAGADAPQRCLHECAEVSGSAVLAVQDDGDVAVVTDRHAFSQVVCGSHKIN